MYYYLAQLPVAIAQNPAVQAAADRLEWAKIQLQDAPAQAANDEGYAAPAADRRRAAAAAKREWKEKVKAARAEFKAAVKAARQG